MICFALLDVVDARELHEDSIAFAIARDDGLGDAELVDAPLDGLERLLGPLPPEVVQGGPLAASAVAARHRS